MTVGMMSDDTFVVEDHHLAIFGSVGFPLRQPLDIGVASMGEASPSAAHQVGQLQVLFAGLWQFVFGVVECVEAEFQFVAML